MSSTGRRAGGSVGRRHHGEGDVIPEGGMAEPTASQAPGERPCRIETERAALPDGGAKNSSEQREEVGA